MFRGVIRKVPGSLEAAAALVTARLLIAVVPFRRLAPMLGIVQHAGDGGEAAGPPIHPGAARVALSLARAVPRLPWTSTCLAQAVAGRLMLAWRRIPSSLVLGVRRDAGALHAHAWLECAGGYVCGGPADDYVRLAAFRTRSSA